MRSIQKLSSVVCFAIGVFSLSAQSYYSVLDTGEILSPGKFDLSLETQFVTAQGTGMNLTSRFDTPLSEETQLRAMLGFGTTDFHAGGFLKWVPIPDSGRQPAIGLIAGAMVGRDENDKNLTKSYFTARVAPVISKTFEPNFGSITPYASLPVGLRFGDGTEVPIHLAFGTELRTQHLENIRWRAELGFNLNKSYSYISLNAVLDIDEAKGVQIR